MVPEAMSYSRKSALPPLARMNCLIEKSPALPNDERNDSWITCCMNAIVAIVEFAPSFGVRPCTSHWAAST
jgi:hypothetical protein